MAVQMADWVISGFFLLSLLLVMRFRNQISREGRQSYNYICAGLTILLLVAIARIYNNVGLFGSIPFLSEPVFYQLIIWIAVMTGATLVISGVSTWLPISRSYRKYNKTKIDHLEFLKRVEQFVGVESRIDIVLSTTLAYIVQDFSFKQGIAFKYSARQGRMVMIASSNDLVVDASDLDRVVFNEQGWRKYVDGAPAQSAGIFTGLPGPIGHPDMVFPICLNKQPVAFFLLWRTKNTACDRDDEMNLKIATDIIARKIQFDQVNLHRGSLVERDAWRTSLEQAFDGVSGLEAEVSALAKGISQMIPADFVSLTLIDEPHKRCRRISVGASGTALVENKLDLPQSSTPAGEAYRLSKLITVNDLRFPGDLTLEGFLTANGMRSLVVLPVKARHVAAVLMLASRKIGSYNSLQAILMSDVRPTLHRLVLKEEMRRAVDANERRIDHLNQFILQIHDGVTMESLSGDAARLMSEQIGVELVRISTVDEQRSFLESKALVANHPAGAMVPGDGTMILSLMPLHEQVVETGRTIQVDRDRRDKVTGLLTEIEARHVFASSVQAVCLVPISVNGNVAGIISFGWTQQSSRRRLDREELLFVDSVAELLSLAIRLSKDSYVVADARMESTQQKAARRGDVRFRNRVKSSLTGILGSMEMIKSQPEPTRENLNRCLSIIDRSARKIEASLQEEDITI